MKITVNGQERYVPEGISLGELIRELGLDKGACAAEVNAELVPRREHAGRGLQEGDRVELVTLVGGG
jgi:sulfur carrier protein